MKDWAYRRIKDNILDSTYPPGASLTPDELSQEFGISRTPIREAFLKLAQEGLIYTRPRVGTFVTEITLGEILQMIDFRALLEGYGVEQIAGDLSEEDIDELEAMVNTCEDSVGKGNNQDFVDHDFQFHSFLIDRIPNPWIKKVMVPIEEITIKERNFAKESLENIEASLVEHRAIVNALRQGDKKQAGDLMRDHWCAIHDRYMKDQSEKQKQS
jgi:DNA-binding GntR family transcriptional regulator